MEQNIRVKSSKAMFTADGVLAVSHFPGGGFQLILREIEAKKNTTEINLGSNGYCSLNVSGNNVVAYESTSRKFTVVQANTKTVKQFTSKDLLRKPNNSAFGGGSLPLAIKGDLIACGNDDSIVLYDVASSKVIHTLEGHLDVVTGVAFLPASNLLVSVAKDKTMRFWNTENGKETKKLSYSGSMPIYCSDGKRMLVGNEIKNVH